MDLPFDVAKTDTKLAALREREEEDLTRILSEKYSIPYIDLSLHDIDVEALRTIPEKEARAAEAGAFARAAKELSIAVHNPNSPAVATVCDALVKNGYEVKKFLVSKRSLEKIFERYKELSFATVSKAGVFIVRDEIVKEFASTHMTRSVLEQKLSAAADEKKSLEYVSYLFEIILAGAFALRASDIHFEPEEEKTRLRMRIDGLLADMYSFDPKTSHQLNSRMKLLSGVKLNITNRAQDGRFSVARTDGEIEMRASFIPGKYGESIVLRILDPETTKVSYADLGIHPKLLKRLELEIRRSNGMLLTTGPTGSGKTTTLYSFLREVYAPEIKIITIEDPIEYHLSGIVQTQVEDNKYTFAEGLRSIVRQDPDIIMVGEIRDGETAGIAIQAALTGHFVFSTLHTNDAAGTFPRLVDLGADPKSFGSALTVSMAQRLVRKLDPSARKERPLTAEEKEMITKVLAPLTDKTLIPEKIETVWEPAPQTPEDTGYKGRIGLYEAIFMDDTLAQFLRDNPPSNEIAKMAASQGYLTMGQDGVLKALAGVTSLSEVIATVDLPR
jgi:type IV pilus assembly protein PilB